MQQSVCSLASFNQLRRGLSGSSDQNVVKYGLFSNIVDNLLWRFIILESCFEFNWYLLKYSKYFEKTQEKSSWENSQHGKHCIALTEEIDATERKICLQNFFCSFFGRKFDGDYLKCNLGQDVKIASGLWSRGDVREWGYSLPQATSRSPLGKV